MRRLDAPIPVYQGRADGRNANKCTRNSAVFNKIKFSCWGVKKPRLRRAALLRFTMMAFPHSLYFQYVMLNKSITFYNGTVKVLKPSGLHWEKLHFCQTYLILEWKHVEITWRFTPHCIYLISHVKQAHYVSLSYDWELACVFEFYFWSAAPSSPSPPDVQVRSAVFSYSILLVLLRF